MSNKFQMLNPRLHLFETVFDCFFPFDDNFQTVESLCKGIEPNRWKLLQEHEREYHLNGKGDIIDGTKTWTDTELESSTLFEVLKTILVVM